MTFDIEKSLREIAERNKRGEKLPVLFTEQEIQAKMNEYINTAKSIISESPINLSRFQEINALPSEIIHHYQNRCSNGEISVDDFAGKVSVIYDSIREVIGWLLAKTIKQSAIDKVDSFMRENPVGSNSFNELFKRLTREAILLPEYAGRETILYQTMILLLQSEINSPEQAIGSISRTGFNSTLKPEQITILWKKLKDPENGFIDPETTPENFAAIFSGKTLPFNFRPIERMKTFTNALLAYFISELFQKENPNDYWKIAEYCFSNAKNLKQSLRNAYDLNTDRKPKGSKAIDVILKSIYTPLQ